MSQSNAIERAAWLPARLGVNVEDAELLPPLDCEVAVDTLCTLRIKMESGTVWLLEFDPEDMAALRYRFEAAARGARRRGAEPSEVETSTGPDCPVPGPTPLAKDTSEEERS